MRMPLRASIATPRPAQSTRLGAMASPSSSPPAPAAAPWRADFLEHTSRMPQASFVLSTVRRDGGGREAPSPRARTCMLRGLWAGLPADDRNPAPRNRPVYESDCPVFTTDARMDKVADLGAGSGSGPGPVEAVWWAEATQTQWRVRGEAWLLGGGGGPGGIGIPAAARAAIGARMRRRRGGNAAAAEKERDEQQQWSWETEVTAHFGNLSPAMRGTFRNPAPGAPRQQAPGAGEGLGQRVDDVEDELARRNFLVCVIVPTEVDRVLLAPDDPRRWLYRFRAEDGIWETVELWP